MQLRMSCLSTRADEDDQNIGQINKRLEMEE